ncbi:MAG: hypothetical protein H0Z24_05480 [Thermosipho sp. (in: Bacteria)]|nr:hypothetical protein [Thermosipho sp. (in: thermotogales)]
MKGNDLSNRVAPTIAFRVDDFLIKKIKNKSIKDKLRNFVLGTNYGFDEEVLKAIDYIFRHTDMTVDLIISKDFYSEKVVSMLKDVPYSRLNVIVSELEIKIGLNLNDYIYYVDNDKSRLSKVGHKYAIDLQQLNNIIRHN